MSDEMFNRLMAGFAAGLGLFLAGGISLLLLKKSLWLRIGAAGGAALLCGFVPALFVPSPIAVAFICVPMLAVLAISCVGSIRMSTVVATLCGFVRRPLGQALILVVGGVAVMAGTMMKLDEAEQDSINEDMKWMAEASSRPDLQVATASGLQTDRGRTVAGREPAVRRSPDELISIEKHTFATFLANGRILRTGPCDESSNCHGWVFTGGRFWLAPVDVEIILADNGYAPVSDPNVGDLVIFRRNSEIAHSALVHSAIPGHNVMVEGKWGWGGIYLHAIADSCYGKEYTFYRSSRSGHLLVGLGGQAANAIHPSGPVPDLSHHAD
jgi:hypothetical protein